jgi:hypothetical protein
MQTECGDGKHIAWFDSDRCRCGAVSLQDADHAIAALVDDQFGADNKMVTDTSALGNAFNAGYLAASQAIKNGTIDDARERFLTEFGYHGTQSVSDSEPGRPGA